LAGARDPIMAAIAMMEERYKAERAQSVSKDDRESARYEAGFQAGKEALQSDANELLDALAAHIAAPSDASEAALFMRFASSFGSQAAAKVLAIKASQQG